MDTRRSFPTYSVVVPVYRNEDSIDALMERLERLAVEYPDDLEAVFVVDGSPDRSAELIRTHLEAGGIRGQLIVLSRNFGSFPAVQTGLAAARGKYHCVMAADLQEPMDFALAAFQLLTNDDADIAIGTRRTRDDPGSTAAAATLYWSAYRRFVNAEIPPGGVDVFACRREISAHLAGFTESHTSLIGLLFWIGYRRVMVPYDRVSRVSGTSAWTLRRRTRYLLDSVFAFTDRPVMLLQFVGIVGIFLSCLVALLITVAWALGLVDVPGYTPVMLAIAASTSAILMGLGVVGSYTWRAYENSKARPVTIASSTEIFE